MQPTKGFGPSQLAKVLGVYLSHKHAVQVAMQMQTKHNCSTRISFGQVYCQAHAAQARGRIIRMAKKPMTMWERDNVQFPRLLAEIAAAGLTSGQYRMLEDSMDLTTADIDELLERAENRYNRIKGLTAHQANRAVRKNP